MTYLQLVTIGGMKVAEWCLVALVVGCALTAAWRLRHGMPLLVLSLVVLLGAAIDWKAGFGIRGNAAYTLAVAGLLAAGGGLACFRGCPRRPK